MRFKLLTEHDLEIPVLRGGCTGLRESTLIKLPYCCGNHIKFCPKSLAVCLKMGLPERNRILHNAHKSKNVCYNFRRTPNSLGSNKTINATSRQLLMASKCFKRPPKWEEVALCINPVQLIYICGIA